MLFSNKAAAFIKMSEKEKAIEACSQAIELNPDYVKAILRRAQTYEETDKPHEAMADFENVLKLDPGHKEARMAVMVSKASLKYRQMSFGFLSSPRLSFFSLRCIPSQYVHSVYVITKATRTRKKMVGGGTNCLIHSSLVY